MTKKTKRSSWGTRMADGKVSPKVQNPALILAAAGAVLAVLDILGVVDVEDELWLTLLGAGGVTFGVGYKSSPGEVVPDGPDREEVKRHVTAERGLTSLEVLGILTLAAVVALLVIVIT